MGIGRFKTYADGDHFYPEDLDSIQDLYAGAIDTANGRMDAYETAHQLHTPGDVKWTTKSAADPGWLLAQGQTLSRATYPALWAIAAAEIAAGSTFYGPGNGTTTFTIADCRGRHPVAKGTHADVDQVGDSDGIALASRTPKHHHYNPWPGGENGGGGNWIGAIRSAASSLTAMGYALRDRITDNSINEAVGPISKLNGSPGDGTSAMVNAGYGFNGGPYGDVAQYRDVGSTVETAPFIVLQLAIKT